MTGPELNSTLSITDNSSKALEAISKAADKAAQQLDDLINRLNALSSSPVPDFGGFTEAQRSIDDLEQRLEQLTRDRTIRITTQGEINPPGGGGSGGDNPPGGGDNGGGSGSSDRQRREMNAGFGGILDFGNKLFGTVSMINGTLDSISAAMSSIDKQTQQEARFRQLAKGEGYDDAQSKLRGEQMRQVAFGRAQELGLDAVGFNEQLMGFANNKAFQSFEEATEFATYLNKMFIASGTSADAAGGAVNQLLQGLSKGKLQGEDLMSILSSAPEIGGLLEQAYARMNNIDLSKTRLNVRELAGEGKLTGDVIKNAILGSAEDIDKKFNDMPLTFETAMTRIKNQINEVIRPFGKALTEFVNSDDFKKISDAIMAIANIVARFVLPAIINIVSIAAPYIAKFAEVLPYIVQELQGIISQDWVGYILGAVAALWAGNAALGVMRTILTAIASHPVIAIVAGLAFAVGFIQKMQKESEKFYEICTKIGLVIAMIFDTIVTVYRVVYSMIINGVVKAAKFIASVFAGIIGGVADGIIRGWNWVMDKLGADDKKIENNWGEDVLNFAGDMWDQSKGGPMDGAIDVNSLLGDFEDRIKAGAADMSKSGSELGWKPRAKTPEEEALEQLKELNRAAKNTETNTGGTEKNTRAVKLDRESILFMKSMTTAEVINRYNNISDSIAINNNFQNGATAQRAADLTVQQLKSAQGAMRGA